MNVYHAIPTIESLAAVVERSYSFQVKRIYLYREMGGSIYYLKTVDDQEYVLKVYKSHDTEAALQGIKVMNYLCKKGLHTAPIVETHDDRSHIVLPLVGCECVAVMYEYLRGEHPDVLENIGEIGLRTAKLHLLMQECRIDICHYGRKRHIDDFISFMREYFPHRPSEIDELAAYGSTIWERAAILPRGFCHDDLHNHNMIKANGQIYLLDFDVISIEHPMFDVASICDRTDFWTVKAEDIDDTLRYLEAFNEVYSRIGCLSDEELSSVFDCIAVRHYRLHGITDRLPLKGSSYMTEAWFDRLMTWLHDYQELAGKAV